MLPETIELNMHLANITTMFRLPEVSGMRPLTEEERTGLIRRWCELREAARTYCVLDCSDELARFMTFDDALAFWKVAPRRYGRNSVVWICNLARCDGGSPGLTEDELDELENAQDERGAR